MYGIEKGSLEEALMLLQDIGLQLNEYQKSNSTIPIEHYRELLEFSISIARQTNEVSETIDEMMQDIERNL
ncbi:hypothetical protein CVD25_17775 [Bacillus canaveralius]|uniref:Uncharacterized protein n=1 Tax=Bacillus canaveralius TaxID=1403243 RepID=A0A2N5GGA0_9BACI|nr:MULTISPECIES: hypothetical protein [Bacillus]PLR79755.1 hypothetical protein CU635_21455 [Bacillus canaveralius]PLR81700.1 hypothetical protein CVD23_18150 [Bacillus sp. V33-4]PLR93165.1 hypothetical protein CVD25_17775 [Bacillus canaveralius]RSK52690.1 hypothetical protein EJA13_10555 [Bacillus canaveralius]